jgi:hypothetical protein
MQITVTVADIMAAGPCEDYTLERVSELWGGNDTLTPQQIAELDIPAADRLWALINACMDDTKRRLFACDCVERALQRESAAGREPDSRSWEAISVSRGFAYGDASEAELAAARCAAWYAARAAAGAATWYAAGGGGVAAWYAAWYAAGAAAGAATWYAAVAAARYAAGDDVRAAEVHWQIEHAIEAIEVAK